VSPRKEVPARKVRWPARLACGCYVTGGRKYRVGGRWICQECRLAAIRAATTTALRAPATDRDPHDITDKEIQP
jgi:hypothetical protein